MWWLVLGLALAPSTSADGLRASPLGKGAAGTAGACNYYYEWLGKVRYPLQPDPHATYTFVMVSSQVERRRIGFLVRGGFIHGVWTSWLTYYTTAAVPFSGANLVNNPPANTYNAIVADGGSVDPFTPGQPMLGSPRNFTLLFKPQGDKGPVAPSLDGTRTADIAPTNVKPYPPAKAGDFWVLANRDYQAFPGYNPGGTTKDTFPVVTAVDLATGKPVDCQAYNVTPDKLQRPPTDPPDQLNYGNVPIRIALKNGSTFNLLGGLGGGSRVQFAPENPPGLVQFTRSPLGPGADVPTIPPGNCAGYLATKTSTRLVSLVRIPHIANYTNHLGLTSSTLYPNPVNPDPLHPWEASYVSFSMYGTSSGFYLPNDPHTNSVAGPEFKVDATGGSTILIWPRNLSRREQRRVFAYANGQGWPIIRGGTQGRQASANVLIRVKGAASNYYGSESNVPCFYDLSQNKHKAWSEIPVQDGSPWVAAPSNLGAAAPQGVTCSSIRALTNGRCLSNLTDHIQATGGSYFASLLSAPRVSPHTFALTGRRVGHRCLVLTRANRSSRACTRSIALRFRYLLLLRARVTLTITRREAGRLVEGRCVAPTGANRRNRACTRPVTVRGWLASTRSAGPNSFRFNGRIGGRRLGPGSYWLTATPAAGDTVGPARSTTFQIAR